MFEVNKDPESLYLADKHDCKQFVSKNFEKYKKKCQEEKKKFADYDTL